jgi:hypothetical protein
MHRLGDEVIRAGMWEQQACDLATFPELNPSVEIKVF